MIAGDCKDRSMVVLVRFIELAWIEIAFSIEIDDVSEVVIEGRSRVLSASAGNLIVHGVGDCFLDIVAVDSSCVAHRMKDKQVRIFRRLRLIGQNNV